MIISKRVHWRTGRKLAWEVVFTCPKWPWLERWLERAYAKQQRAP